MSDAPAKKGVAEIFFDLFKSMEAQNERVLLLLQHHDEAFPDCKKAVDGTYAALRESRDENTRLREALKDARVNLLVAASRFGNLASHTRQDSSPREAELEMKKAATEVDAALATEPTGSDDACPDCGKATLAGAHTCRPERPREET